MKCFFAVVILVGALSSAATAESPSSDHSTQSEARRAEASRAKALQDALESDPRLANLTNSPPQKIGLLSYYPNQGGGYTFLQGKDIVFYALPYTPSTYMCEVRAWQQVIQLPPGINPLGAGVAKMANVTQTIVVPTIGPSKVAFGGQTIYRTEMSEDGKDGRYRKDIRLAYWSREQSDGNFLFWIVDDDHETRIKLKSIVTVLEHGSQSQMSKQ